MSKIEIFCTLGPSSLNKNFLKSIDKKVSLVRLNMSHLSLRKLSSTIKFIKKIAQYQFVLIQRVRKLGLRLTLKKI